MDLSLIHNDYSKTKKMNLYYLRPYITELFPMLLSTSTSLTKLSANFIFLLTFKNNNTKFVNQSVS